MTLSYFHQPPLKANQVTVEALSQDAQNTASNRQSGTRNTRSASLPLSFPLHGEPNTVWSIKLIIGDDSYQQGQSVEASLDTGSSVMAFADKIHCGTTASFDPDQSSTFASSNTAVSNRYGLGTLVSSWSGFWGRDNVYLSSEAGINTAFPIFDSEDSFCQDSARWNGILGMAYPSLSIEGHKQTPFFDQIADQEGWPKIFIFSLCQVAPDGSEQGGTLAIGEAKDVIGAPDVFYTPVIKKGFFSVQILSLAVGNHEVDSNCCDIQEEESAFRTGSETIVDSGTTNIFFHSTLFDKIITRFKAETLQLTIPEEFWTGDARMEWPKSNTHDLTLMLPVFNITLRGDNSQPDFTLVTTPTQYLRATSGYGQTFSIPQHPCQSDCVYWQFAITKEPTDDKKTNILSSVLMTGFSVVFDKENHRVGFARKDQCKGSISDERLDIQIENQTYDSCCFNNWNIAGPSIAGGGIIIVGAIAVAITATTYKLRHSLCGWCSLAPLGSLLYRITECFARHRLSVPVDEEGTAFSLEEGADSGTSEMVY